MEATPELGPDEAQADRLVRAALQLALAHAPASQGVEAGAVQEEAARMGLLPQETLRGLERLRQRGEVIRKGDAWTPRARTHDGTRVLARERVAHAFWGWR